MRDNKSLILAATAVIVTAAAAWYMQRPAAPKQVAWADILAEADAGGYRIISTEELADRYRKDPSGISLIDTRQEWEYRTGHIAGARNFPMEPTWWARWRKANDLEIFLGPDKEQTIVFY